MTTAVRELAERLGTVHEVSQNTSGSQQLVTLRPLRSDGSVIATKATLALAQWIGVVYDPDVGGCQR